MLAIFMPLVNEFVKIGVFLQFASLLPELKFCTIRAMNPCPALSGHHFWGRMHGYAHGGGEPAADAGMDQLRKTRDQSSCLASVLTGNDQASGSMAMAVKSRQLWMGSSQRESPSSRIEGARDGAAPPNVVASLTVSRHPGT
jgi:hypothetical protein